MAFLPITYNIRSLLVRKSSTVLAVFGIGATVAVVAGVMSLQQGFKTLFAEKGREDLAILLRHGAGSEGESVISREQAQILIKGTGEFKTDAQGRPLASAELYLAVRRFKLGGGETNVPIRGVQPMSLAIHGEVLRMVDGRKLEPGADEVMVGQALVDRIRNCRVGEVLVLNTTPFRVVGVFKAKGGYESEIWGDAERLMEALQRPIYNRVIAVLENPASLPALAARLENDKQAPAKVMSEKEYLLSQTRALSYLFVGLGIFLGALMGIGAVFTGINTMLSALAARTHEIGILLSMGFKPVAIFFAFLIEALLIGLMGGLVGCLFVLPFQGMRTGTTNWQTFTEIAFAFRITPTILFMSVMFSVMLGILGGFIPAYMASRLRPTQALRRG